MSSGVAKKILMEKTSIIGVGLIASDGVNISRVADFITYKSHKNVAMQKYGMKLDNFESVKECAAKNLMCTGDEVVKVARITIANNIVGIGVEAIVDATFKASKVLNGRGAETRAWGKIADSGFKTANGTVNYQGGEAFVYDWSLRCGYMAETYGVSDHELWFVSHYPASIFNNPNLKDGLAISNQVMVVETIIEAAVKASQLEKYYGVYDELTETEMNGNMAGEVEPLKKPETGEVEHLKKRHTEFSNDEKLSEKKKNEIMVGVVEPLKKCHADVSGDDIASSNEVGEGMPGFMKRDKLCIFMDSKMSRMNYEELMDDLDGLLANINWARITRFMEFKARKEYAMETYGVKLGDFKSLKENAVKSFVLTEAEAENMASQTMSMDSESIAFEKIADAAFKASKILNWEVVANQSRTEEWSGNIADASGFKSPGSLTNFCQNKDIEARKAYTMEAFEVSSVDIDYITAFAIKTFRVFNSEELKESEAIIMACECVAIDHVVEAALKNLNLTLESDPLDEKVARSLHKMSDLDRPLMSNFVFMS